VKGNIGFIGLRLCVYFICLRLQPAKRRLSRFALSPTTSSARQREDQCSLAKEENKRRLGGDMAKDDDLG